jgi:hypothetical protein
MRGRSNAVFRDDYGMLKKDVQRSKHLYCTYVYACVGDDDDDSWKKMDRHMGRDRE